ncbi:MAG: hypothetical protein A2V70_12165 [Planctomycetes bacterium RBG_13_63_9]|nr:MAG: hypothetical protein A2V70_12165 [Planctomycetes bacterium RBG_13_63_9]
MGQPTPPSPALLLLAAFSRHDAALAWARHRAVETWGPVAIESPTFQFDQTDYYQQTMGTRLLKVFWLLQRPFDPADLADVKLQTNRWEHDYAELGRHAQPRPLNLDPGYLSLGKLVLASTKDHAHRIYLAQGIYAEVTLNYKDHRWQPHPWTFADYRREDYHDFFSECRQYLHEQVREQQREGLRP